jgi:phytol kinase
VSQGDIVGLILSYIYAFGLLLIVEALGRQLSWPQHLTRKLIHIGAGMWTWGILYFFDHWYIGIIPFATFIVMNYLFYRRQTFQQMDDEASSPGTVYFAFSITLLFTLFWRTGPALDRVPIALAAVMVMTWGDALAHLVGKRFGGHTYTFFRHTRSWEGTAAMVIFGALAMFLTLWLLPGSALSPNSTVLGPTKAAIMTAFTITIASLAEGVSPSGLDNLSVPLVSALALYLLYQL